MLKTSNEWAEEWIDPKVDPMRHSVLAGCFWTAQKIAFEQATKACDALSVDLIGEDPGYRTDKEAFAKAIAATRSRRPVRGRTR